MQNVDDKLTTTNL